MSESPTAKQQWYNRFEPQLIAAFESLTMACFVKDSQATWQAWIDQQWAYWQEYGCKQD